MGFHAEARNRKKIDANALRKSFLGALPGFILGNLCMSVGFTSYLKIWDFSQWNNIFLAIFIAVVMWLILNTASLGGLFLRICQATNVYGKDAPEKVREVIKSFLNR
jgi:hypothetical protein